MKKRLKIVLTNDDGIHARGMSILVSVLNKLDIADLYIVAPAHDQSGMSMSFSYRTPLAVEQVEYKENHVAGAWSVEGSPVDCSKIAISALFKDDAPDLIISGINHGGNGGRNVFYSGTVGAAMESVIKGIPALALSQEKHISFFNEKEGAKYLKKLIEYVCSSPFSQTCGLNVNFPYLEGGELWKGISLTVSGNEYCIEDPINMGTIHNKTYYSLKSVRCQLYDSLSQELQTLMQGRIAVAPIGLSSITGHCSEAEFHDKQKEFDEFFSSLETHAEQATASVDD